MNNRERWHRLSWFSQLISLIAHMKFVDGTGERETAENPMSGRVHPIICLQGLIYKNGIYSLPF